MRILFLSDLHLEQWGVITPLIDLKISRPDVVVLAGDIHSGAKAIAWAVKTFPDVNVLYVHGNHEAYGHNLESTQRDIKEACLETFGHVHFLDSKEFVLCNVRFLGATLWTDFKLFGDEKRVLAMYESESMMNDYHRIRLEARLYKKMRAPDTEKFHHQQRKWIGDKLAEPFDGKTVVITHMAPSMRSVPNQYSTDIVSAAYASNLDALAQSADVWIHGHMQSSSDYKIGQCRVVCNPRGYRLSGGQGENLEFDPNKIIII